MNAPHSGRPWRLLLVALLAMVVGWSSWLLQPCFRKVWYVDEGATRSAVPPESVVDCLGWIDVDRGIRKLTPLQPGRVIEVPVQENQKVAAHAALLSLDPGPAQFHLAQAQAALAAARARRATAQQAAELQPNRIVQQKSLLVAAQQRLSAARHLLVHKQDLLNYRLISAEELAAAADGVKELEAMARLEQTRLDELQGQDPSFAVQEAEAEVTGAEARVAEARYALAQRVLRAPEAGTVLRVNVGVGEVLDAQPRQPAIVFVPDRPRVVRAEIEQEFIRRVKVGQRALIQNELNPQRTWTGHVARIAGWSTDARSILTQPPRLRDVPTVECLIRFDGNPPPWRIGERVQVALDEESR